MFIPLALLLLVGLTELLERIVLLVTEKKSYLEIVPLSGLKDTVRYKEDLTTVGLVRVY